MGQDSLDWKKIFTAAKTGGVKNYFVEMDLDLMKAQRALSPPVARLEARYNRRSTRFAPSQNVSAGVSETQHQERLRLEIVQKNPG